MGTERDSLGDMDLLPTVSPSTLMTTSCVRGPSSTKIGQLSSEDVGLIPMPLRASGHGKKD